MKLASQHSIADVFITLVEAHGSAKSLGWLQRVQPPAGQALDRGLLMGALAGAGRRFPGADRELTVAELERLHDSGVLAPASWTLGELVRGALLLRALERIGPDEAPLLVEELFRKGDSAERRALLRTLPLCDEPERFLSTAVEACRTHVLEIFEAIACENAYPARCFPELNFNQMVIKALFMEVALERIHDWRRRHNPELVRMARDYATERRAAGRSIPADIGLIADPEGT